MPTTFQHLLEASVHYLEDLKAKGTRHVSLSPESLSTIAHLRAPTPAQPIPTPNQPAPAAIRPEPTTPAYEFASQKAPPTAVPEAPLSSPIETEKTRALQDLRTRALVCMKCPNLANSRKNVVFGVGNIDADLMFVGEAPGADEDAAGEPFVGKAGQLLTRIIETMGLRRDQVYIANILKCRPDTPGKSHGNRKPTADEMKTCSPYLHAQIDLIRPKVLVALGATAVEGLLGNIGGITRARGQWRDYRDTPLMPTYHPAYLLRNQALQEKRKVWEDMIQVMERLNLTVTEKHRSYFLPK